MFEEIQLIGSQERRILLHTRMRTLVRNSQVPQPGDLARRKFDLLLRQHHDWEFRKPPCGFYNCFGHLWARDDASGESIASVE